MGTDYSGQAVAIILTRRSRLTRPHRGLMIVSSVFHPVQEKRRRPRIAYIWACVDELS
jgi:hypothetical protein